MEEIENYLFGARVLEKGEVEDVLPNFETVISEIEHIRSFAAIQSPTKETGIKEKIKTKQMNNTFSILGERGSGKTSVLYTIIDRLEKDSAKNIIFDFVEPDAISESGTIIGCILSLLQGKLEEILNKIKEDGAKKSDKIRNDFFRDCIYIEANQLRKDFNSLLENYLYLDKRYRQLLIQNYTDLNTYIKKSALVLNADTGFQEKFSNYISEYIAYVKEYMQVKEQSEEPLLYFVFDDIDLCPEKAGEIINVITNYLQHKNVVCFISGKFKMFEDELRWSLIKKETIRPADLEEGIQRYNNDGKLVNDKEHFYYVKDRLAKDVLLKAIPTPRRYFLSQWNDERKPYFRKVNEKNEVLCLGEVLRKILKQLYGDDYEDIFAYENAESKVIYLPDAFTMFSQKARGMSYVFYAAIELLDVLRDSESDEEQKTHAIQNLIETIWHSSVTLQECIVELQDYIVFGNTKDNSVLLLERICNLIFNFGGTIYYGRDMIPINQKRVLYFFYYSSLLLMKPQNERNEMVSAFYKKILYSSYNAFTNQFETEMHYYKHFIIDFINHCGLAFGIRLFRHLTEERVLWNNENNGNEIKKNIVKCFINEVTDNQEKYFLNVFKSTMQMSIWNDVDSYNKKYYEQLINSIKNVVVLNFKYDDTKESDYKQRLFINKWQKQCDGKVKGFYKSTDIEKLISLYKNEEELGVLLKNSLEKIKAYKEFDSIFVKNDGLKINLKFENSLYALKYYQETYIKITNENYATYVKDNWDKVDEIAIEINCSELNKILKKYKAEGELDISDWSKKSNKYVVSAKVFKEGLDDKLCELNYTLATRKKTLYSLIEKATVTLKNKELNELLFGEPFELFIYSMIGLDEKVHENLVNYAKTKKLKEWLDNAKKN